MIMRQQSCRLRQQDLEAGERFKRLRYEAGWAILENPFRQEEKRNWSIGRRKGKCITEAEIALI